MLYTIGDFSKICEVAIHTLRYWEKEGLLVPEKTDSTTGYRYYSSRQLYLVQEIKAAKLNKFKNKEIRNIVDRSYGIQLLFNKKDELIKIKNEAEESIRRLDFAINELQLQKSPESNFVVIKKVPEHLYLTHRETYQNIYALLADFIDIYNRVWNGKPPITYPYETIAIYYHDSFPDSNLDAECCIAIDHNSDEMIGHQTVYQVKRIPGIEMAASCLHYGKLEMIEETYEYLVDWIKANEYELCGYPRQNFISNESTPDLSNYELANVDSQPCEVTEIIVPIKKRDKG